jgi:glycerol-3-phosphate dehydrogenase
MIAPSQGVHIILDRAFLGGDTALMIPRTPDGRVLFAIPWHDRVLIGTTATLLSVSPRTFDSWVAKRMIPFIEPNPRLHLFDPAAVKAALLAQFSIPVRLP